MKTLPAMKALCSAAAAALVLSACGVSDRTPDPFPYSVNLTDVKAASLSELSSAIADRAALQEKADAPLRLLSQSNVYRGRYGGTGVAMVFFDSRSKCEVRVETQSTDAIDRPENFRSIASNSQSCIDAMTKSVILDARAAKSSAAEVDALRDKAFVQNLDQMRRDIASAETPATAAACAASCRFILISKERRGNDDFYGLIDRNDGARWTLKSRDGLLAPVEASIPKAPKL